MNSTLIGFKGGTAGLFSGNFITITHEHIRKFRNTGGFHLLGRTNDSIKTEFEKRKAEETCRKLRLDGLVCVGGTYTAADTARVA